ncbi:MAG: hypothetical protein HQK58_01240 [Deltaproteobacteria bacterium]|nr:hypothetical protein [Deltaproteobacteria bacterium]
MGIFTIEYSDDMVAAAIKVFLETLPPQSVRSVRIFPELPQEWDHIPYASDEEQKEIEEELKDPECHILSSEEIVTIKI